MAKGDYNEKARQIARLITETDADYRGNLFLEVSILLNYANQHATANYLRILAHEYGLNNET